MAGDKREVRVAVVGDAAQLQRELKKAEGHLSGFGDNAKKSGDILKSALFGGAVLYGAKKLVDAAGDLQQSIGGTAAVFKEASGAVNDFTKNSADLVGMSENAARTITSRLGASLKGFGMSTEDAAKEAINLTKTGADLAATLGGKSSDAVAALGSALRGEYDPLEQFGIALKASQVNAKAVSMGLAESETSVTAYAKGQATLALITEQSAFAQGQFGREADTAQGQAQRAQAKTEDAAASLGKSMLPIYTKIQETIGFVADAFTALPGPAQTAVLGFAGVIAIGPSIVEGFKLAQKAVSNAITLILDAGTKAVTSQAAIASINVTNQAAGASATAAAGGMSLLGPAVLAVGAAAIIGGIAYKSYADEQAAVKENIEAITKTFNELTGAITENTFTSQAASLNKKGLIDNLNKARISTREFTDVLDDNRDSLVEQGEVERLAGIARQYGVDSIRQSIQAIRDRGGAQNELIARLLETNSAEGGIVSTLYDGIDAYNINKEKVKELNQQKSISTGKTSEQVRLENELIAANKESADKIKDLIDATKELYEIRTSNEEAEIATRKALVDYNESLREGGLSVDERRTKEIALEQTFIKQSEAFRDLIGIQKVGKEETYSAAEASIVQANKLGELANTLAPDGAVRKNLQQFANQLYLTASQDNVIKLRVETEAAVAKIRALLRLSADATIGIDELNAYSANFPDAKAGGGPVDAGMPYLVGEKGPELFVPSGYGRIMDAFSTSKALLSNTGGSMGSSGQAINITINTVAGDPIAIETIVVDALSRANRRGVTGLTP